MSYKAQDIIETILAKLHSYASTETVVGDPVEVSGVTILPVIKLSVGFAAGGGDGSRQTEKNEKDIGGGGGGGGGASVQPVGFIVLDGKDVRFIGVTGKGRFEMLFDTVPDLLSKLGIIKRDGRGKKGKGHKDGDDEPSKEL